MKNKKIIVLVLLVLSLFVLSGCATIPTDAEGNTILITSSTQFSEVMDTEGFFSALFVYPMAVLINNLTPILTVGGAIIATSIIVNTLAVALTFKSNLQSQKMQDIQPEIERIRKKYEGKTDQASQQKMVMEQQALWKKHGINPFSSFIGLFVQMPVLMAMYYAVQRSEAVATEDFFGLNLEVTTLEGFTTFQIGYILLFIAMIICQFLSMKIPTILANRDAKKEAEAQFRKYEPAKNPMGGMMYGMIAMIGFISFSLPSAMTLYWTISSAVNIVKTIILKKLTSKYKNKA